MQISNKIKMKSSLLFILCINFQLLHAQVKPFDVYSSTVKASIVYDPHEASIDSIAAHLLAEDIQRVTGYLPVVSTDVASVNGNAIIIGNINSTLIKSLSKSNVLRNRLSGKWECYGITVLDKPFRNINQAMVIIGSDDRGTVYGVFHISEMLGVNPWYWWADVNPSRQKNFSIFISEYVSSPPSVKYRGIFLNDEDWGLQPWAAKTFEPEVGDIGPKTYAKIFELLLRLKANMIWPAMHPSTKAFFSIPGNKEIAAKYSIIVGSSHAEPMLRNNVGEWDVKKRGAFNYITNKETVQKYWEDRVKESRDNEVVYTLGMRGVHDSGIEGVKTPEEAKPLVERILADQREMLKNQLAKNIADIPQAFIAYKEVLDIYDKGLKLPDDVTLMWPDDNYGYIQRLNNDAEQKRSGGSGVYYHASYWGRPHDYLWLSSTNPALIREEMMKAYEMKADRMWILNVGDIKPLEYNIQLFMDMAYSTDKFKQPENVEVHMMNWIRGIFGNDHLQDIYDVLSKYYQLAFERRPEFMGWSQTEPTTPVKPTEYNHLAYNDQAQQRINSYDALERKVKAMEKDIPQDKMLSFYELVYYPVVCASLMNKKFLYRDKSLLFASQGMVKANPYTQLSRQAYDGIIKETEKYNNILASGKWKYIMSMKPRDLPVYQLPPMEKIDPDQSILQSKDNPARYYSVYASNFTRKQNTGNAGWQLVDGLGHTGKSMEALPLTSPAFIRGALISYSAPKLEYEFIAPVDTTATVYIYTLPTHPLNKNYSMRYGVGVDDDEQTLMYFVTVGRSDEWKQNVLSNSAMRKFNVAVTKGKHILRISMIDPGVILDRIVIDFGGMAEGYGVIPETKN